MTFRDILGHEQPHRLLEESFRQGRLAHAYLFAGEEGIGKRRVAMALASALLCQAQRPDNRLQNCGECSGCYQTAHQTHPDLHLIEPDGQTIKIDQIRQLQNRLSLRTYTGGYKVAILDEADRTTVEAANSLLKTLEEPPPGCLLILITPRPAFLLPTVRSRCQTLRFSTLPPDRMIRFLIEKRGLAEPEARAVAARARGRVGPAMTMDLMAVREELEETLALLHGNDSLEDAAKDADRMFGLLDEWERWGRDLLLVRLGADTALLTYTDRLDRLRSEAAQKRTEPLLGWLLLLQRIRSAVRRNLNRTLALELLRSEFTHGA
jgi:DNA polymerase-3 subunit delta'